MSTEKQYLPGYQLIHEGLIDFYTTTATTPEEAVQAVKDSPLSSHLVEDGMGFIVYRRVQRPNSILWDLEKVGSYHYREGAARTNEAEEKQAKELHRLVEKLTMAHISATHAYANLVDANLWANKEQAPKVEALYRRAEQLQKDIDKLLTALKKGREHV